MSPSLRRIRWRLIWTSILALVLALGTFYLNQKVYASSDDQCAWVVVPYQTVEKGKKVTKARVEIREVLPDGVAEEAGLLEGDELLQIHNVHITPQNLATHGQALINAQPEGRVLVYRVRRNGRDLVMPVRLVKNFNASALMVLITGLVSWAIGLLVVISSPQRKIARHFFHLGVMALLSSVVARGFTGNLPSHLMAAVFAVDILVLFGFPALWLHFFLQFPHPFELRRNRRFLTCLYGAAFLLFLLGLFMRLTTPLAYGVPAALADVRRFMAGPWLNTILTGLVYGQLVAGLALFWTGTFKVSPRRRRALLPPVLFSTALLVDILAYNILAGRDQGLMFARHSWVFFLPLPLLPFTFAYAIFRHGFFDVRRAILRWMTYFLVLGAILAGYLACLAWLMAQGIQLLPSAWMGVMLGLAALPLGLLLKAILTALRRRFRRDLASARELILGNLRETKKRFSEEALVASLVATLRDAFRPQALLALPVDDRKLTLPPVENVDPGDPYAEAVSRPQVLSLPSYVLRHARENRELVLGLGCDESEWIQEQDPSLRAHLDALGLQVMVLLMAGEDFHTALLLGGKYAELNYGRDDRELLRDVAISASIHLESAVLHRRLLDQGRLEQELQTARKIQEGLVTTEAPRIHGFQIALRLEPTFETGGDLLWVKRRQTGRWIAAVGDVSGKGLAAALYMSQATALLKFATQKEGLEFENLLPALDHTLRNLMSPRDFLTLSIIEWDEDGSFKLLRAGHPPAILIRGAKPSDLTQLAVPGRGLGLRPSSPGDWKVYRGTLEPGQWLVMYSDGLTEAMNTEGELYGQERFNTQLRHYWGLGSPRAACEAVFREVAQYEVQNRDDRTLFILGREKT